MGENFVGILELTDDALASLGLPEDQGALLEGYVRTDGDGLSVIAVRHGRFVVASYSANASGLVKVQETAMVGDLSDARGVVAEALFRPLSQGKAAPN
jgi:hypothetical protein